VIENGDIIKHEAFLDVAFEVHYAYGSGINDDVMVTGEWMNQGQVNSWYIPNNIPHFTIKKERIHEWFKVVYPKKDKCLRHCDWVPVMP
jgi:hypothetical protein